MNIYLSGIGGVGIGALAGIAHSAGYNVFGSDQNHSMMTEKLEKQGIEISFGIQDGEFLKKKFLEDGIDWFVYTAALPKDHPELKVAEELGIKITKRDEFLNQIIQEKNLKLIAVSGTHGKTTTTGMFVWLFKQLNIPVSWSVGATLTFGDSGHYNPKSEFFVYEADEFDRNFLHFSPELSLITSMNYDHADIYPTEENYFEAFNQFAKQSNFTILWDDQHPDVFDDIENKVVLKMPDPELKLDGLHNRKNATLVLEGLEYLASNGSDFGEDYFERAVEALNNFPGTDRRFEKISDGVYSDYGHHPEEIKATLEMAREVADKQGYKKIALIYQPHQNVRQVEVQDAYTKDIFADADEIYWLPTYLSRENPNLDILTPEFLSRQISDKTKIFDLDEDLAEKIKALNKDGYLILAMSAGSLDGWVRKKLK